MSANNWTKCPKCASNKEAKDKAEALALGESYGKIPASEYLEKLSALKLEKPLDDTLREDYEIGIWKGFFTVDYSAHCSVCGFKFNHKFKSPPL